MRLVDPSKEVSLAEAFTDPGVIGGYHAHLYYAPETRPIAARLRAAIAENFPQARIGNWHNEPVGPHPVAMYQVAFALEDFPRLVPWLMLNRDELDVLVHPLTDDSVADHTQFALWLGTPVPLRVEVLRRGPRTG
jgi:aromatic ring-cleaving dioxygenase